MDSPIPKNSQATRIARAQAIKRLFASPSCSPFPDAQWATQVAAPILLDARGLAQSSLRPSSIPVPAPRIRLDGRDSITVALDLSGQNVHPTILIFGSARRAGGGWDKGARAQEEDVALSSTWGLQAEMVSTYYDLAKSDSATAMHPDMLLWSECGFILSPSLDAWLPEPAPCSFVAFAAPNAKGLARSGIDTGSPVTEQRIRHHMEVRCAATLALAMDKQVQHLVLGAIGCGVFGLSPQMVAQTWRRTIAATGYSGAITFALPSGPNSFIGIAFQEAFGQVF